MAWSLSIAGQKLRKKLCAAALVLVVSASVPAWAGTILGLSIGSGGRVVYWSKPSKPWLSGSGIKVEDLMFRDDVLPILGGRLAFSDRDFLSYNGHSRSWGAGGTLLVHGCVNLIHSRGCNKKDFRGILFTGTFLDAKIVDVNGTEMLEAQVKDQINPQLAALLHLSSTPYVGQLDLKLSSLRSNRWWTCDTVQGGSLVDGNVPAPSSIWLLGSSLLGLGGIRFGRALLARSPLR